LHIPANAEMVAGYIEPHRSTCLELGHCSLQVTKAAPVGGQLLDLGHRRPI